MMIGPILATRGLHNDCLMFCRAKRQQCIILKNIQVKYGQLLGRAINYDKSAIFFSRNVGNSTKEELSDIVGTTSPLNTGRYMGLSSLIGRDKKAILIVGQIQWVEKQESVKAGKEVLIKSETQAILAFCMTSFLLPLSLADEL